MASFDHKTKKARPSRPDNQADSNGLGGSDTQLLAIVVLHRIQNMLIDSRSLSATFIQESKSGERRQVFLEISSGRHSDFLAT
jgi:hypothetical protein